MSLRRKASASHWKEVCGRAGLDLYIKVNINIILLSWTVLASLVKLVRKSLSFICVLCLLKRRKSREICWIQSSCVVAHGFRVRQWSCYRPIFTATYLWLGENKHTTFQNSTRLIFNGFNTRINSTQYVQRRSHQLPWCQIIVQAKVALVAIGNIVREYLMRIFLHLWGVWLIETILLSAGGPWSPDMTTLHSHSIKS